MIYKGSCHCGQVAFEAEGNLEKIMECNCSICSKRGSLHWFITPDNFRLLSPEDDMGTYTFSKHTIKHRYCLKCGCAPFSEGIAPSGNDMVAINARCLDGVDLSPIKVGHFDGRSL
ncbi:MAG: GFA family protein [Gallionellaceae bacterium]